MCRVELESVQCVENFHVTVALNLAVPQRCIESASNTSLALVFHDKPFSINKITSSGQRYRGRYRTERGEKKKEIKKMRNWMERKIERREE